MLIYETFMVGNERFGRPSNPEFLLRPGELLQAFADLAAVAFEQGYAERPKAGDDSAALRVPGRGGRVKSR